MTAPSAQFDAIEKVYASESAPRARDAAEQAGLSEGAMLRVLASADGAQLERVPYERVVELRAEAIAELMAGASELGELMAITRNEHAVHEKPGAYGPMRVVHGQIAVITGAQIDLRLFLQHWRAAFYIEERSARSGESVRASFQVFDASGQAVHKMYARDAAQHEAARALAERLRASEAGAPFEPAPDKRAAAADGLPEGFDRAAFQQGWLELKDTHDFGKLLRAHRLSRTQALRAAPEGMARALESSCIKPLLEEAAESGQAIMVFVGNPGCIQIHTGPIERVVEARGWLNVLDAGFNLHLKPEAAAEVWLVRKPTVDGVVTSIELFDADGEEIALFFGARKPGQPESDAWRALAEGL